MSDIYVTNLEQAVDVAPAGVNPRIISHTQHIDVNPSGERITSTVHTYDIVVNPGGASVEVNMSPQTIVVNSPVSSVAVINAGPPGPRGAEGPPDLESYIENEEMLIRRSGTLQGLDLSTFAQGPEMDTAIGIHIAAHVALADPHPVYLTAAEDAVIMAAHVAAADPHPGYLTAAEGNTAYVNVGGDTMTGPLTGTSVVMSGTVTSSAHVLTFNGEALKFTAVGGYSAWFNGATRIGYLQGHSSGMILHSETGTLQLLGTASFGTSPSMPGVNISTTGVVYWAAYGGGWQMTDTTWIRSYGSKSVYIGTGIFGTEGGISINAGGGMLGGYHFYLNGAGYVSTNFVVNSQVQGNRNQVADPGWGNASFLANPGAGGAAIAFHAGGTAPQIRIATGSNYFYFRDAGGISYVPLAASAFDVSSARATKQDIMPWPPNPKNLSAAANPERPTKRLRDLKPVSFRRKEAAAMAEVPSDEEAQKDPKKYKIHKCHVDTCGGSMNAPCARRLNWERGEIGLIAEEVLEVFPEVVTLDADGNPEAISLAPLVAAVLAAVQELDLRVDVLEGAT